MAIPTLFVPEALLHNSQEVCKMRILSIVAVVVVILGMESGFIPAHAQNLKPLAGITVVIDPGHGGADPGHPFNMRVNGKDYRYDEAAYTYVAAYDLRDLIVQFGGTAALTCESEQAETAMPAGALDPRPLPRDAKYANNGKTVRRSDDGGLKDRANIASAIFAQTRGSKCYFVSVHTDAYGSGSFSGSHVCYQKDREIPTLARAIAARIELYGCMRCKDGEPIGSGMSARDFEVLRDNANPEAVLLEMAVPANPDDSWRMRSDENRRRYLAAVVLSALIDLQAEQPLSQLAQTQTDELVRQLFGTVEPNPTPISELEQSSSMSAVWHWILGFTGVDDLWLRGWWLISFVGMILSVWFVMASLSGRPRTAGIPLAVATRCAIIVLIVTAICFGSWLWRAYGVISVILMWQSVRRIGGWRSYRNTMSVTYMLHEMIMNPIVLILDAIFAGLAAPDKRR